MSANTPVVELPPEQVASLAELADRAAELTATYLAELGFRGSADEPLFLPPNFLLDLGAALCLVEWDDRGLVFHRRAGLPAGRDAVLDAIAAAIRAVPGLPVPPAYRTRVVRPSGVLSVIVCRLAAEELAWAGRPLLGADIVLDAVDDAVLVEGLAQLAWHFRHRPRSTN